MNGVSKTFNILTDGDPDLWWAANFPKIQLSGETSDFFQNVSGENLRIAYRWEPANQDVISLTEFTDNPTAGQHDGWATVCLAPATTSSLYFQDAWIDLESNKPVISLYSENLNMKNIEVTFPNLTVNSYPAQPEVDLPYMEGFYEVSASGGWENIIGNVLYKVSNNTQSIPKPVISSVVRNPDGSVSISGTAKAYSVIRVIPDNNDDEPIAFGKVPQGSTAFLFTTQLPENFSGYLRCQDGNHGSPGTLFSI